MKHVIITLFILISTNASATHWLEYFVYVEVEYYQGPWSGYTLLEESNSDYRYLSPVAFEGLFGSDKTDLARAFLSKLSEQKPKRYRWEYDVSYENEIVTIKPLGKIENWQTVKNEITATMALNSFPTVKFEFEDSTVISTLDDLTLPYMDLRDVRSFPKRKSDTIKKRNTVWLKPVQTVTESKPTRFYFWLILSVVLNVLLIVLLIRGKRN